MKHITFFLLLFAIQLSAQQYKEGKEPWRDEDLSVPHRWVPVTIKESVLVLQHKAPQLLGVNAPKERQVIYLTRSVPVSTPRIIPFVTNIRVDTVAIPFDRIRVDTFKHPVYLPGKTVYREKVVFKTDTAYIEKIFFETQYVNSPWDIALRWAVVAIALVMGAMGLQSYLKPN